MWMVRSGYESFLIDDFLENNLVAIGWDVGDLTGKSREDIKNLIRKKIKNKERSNNASSQVNRFIFDINIGDYVISHNYGDRTYYLGKIISDYEYSDKITKVDKYGDHYRDVRNVEWLAEIPKNKLKKSTQGTLNTSTTVFHIKENAKNDILNIYQETYSANGKIWSMNISRNKDYDEAWGLFKEKSCVSIDYFLDNKEEDYSSFSTTDELREYLNDEKSIQPELINRFVNKMDKGDIFIAHKGNSTLAGIGIISSDYIYQNDILKHIRKIDWIYTPDNMQLKKGSFFKTSNIVRLDELYSKFVNEIFARIAGKDENVRNNLFNFLFNQYYDNYYSTDEGKWHFNEYSVEKEHIQKYWNIIKEKDSKNEFFADLVWDEIFGRDVGVIHVGAKNLRNMIQKSYGFSDNEMNESAILFYNTINDVLNHSDNEEQKKILVQYSQNKLSKGISLGRFTPVLFYLNDFYAPMNNKTLKTFRFLSLALGSEEELSSNLEEYIDNNFKYKHLLNELSLSFNFDKFDILDVRIFDEFSHWICAVDDYLWSKKVKILPINLLRYVEKPIFESNKKRNKIYFGAPGTGKSYNLNQDKYDLLEDNEENYERVTFHPDYSYANFVGTYKPVPEGNSITYKYVPGPFMRILKKAINNPSEPYLLIIEEINRANVAAVFGDVFQLLDRTNEYESEYPIGASEDMKTYLNQDKISLPSNLFIWATMNSADQGVFPMDTAFKRRWDFKYFSINHNEKLIENTRTIINDEEVNWNKLRKQINDELLSYKINEDKLMGPFFAFNEFMGQEIPTETFKDIFKNKIIMYLFEDAARAKRNDLFSGARTKDYVTYSEICEEFDRNGLKIFKFISDDE